MRLQICALTVGLLLAAAPVAAQTQQQSNWCGGRDGATPDLQISGCTAVIQSGKYVGTKLASAFISRGVAYDDKGQYDRAIQDYDQAIKLDPNYATALSNRADAIAKKKK
jgi:tetratricopeptide (TPR) repeat protein